MSGIREQLDLFWNESSIKGRYVITFMGVFAIKDLDIVFTTVSIVPTNLPNIIVSKAVCALRTTPLIYHLCQQIVLHQITQQTTETLLCLRYVASGKDWRYSGMEALLKVPRIFSMIPTDID